MSQTEFERKYKVSRRIDAPLDKVWDELVPLTRHFPESAAVTLVSRTDPVRAQMKVAWGPISWKLDVVISLVDVSARERLAWSASIADMDAGASGVIELAPRGPRETSLDYEVHAWMRQQRLISRGLSMTLAALISDHADELVRRVWEQAEKHSLAEERLLSRQRRDQP